MPAAAGTPDEVGAAAPTVAKGFAGKAWFWWPWPLLVVADLVSKAMVFAFLQRQAHQLGIPADAEKAWPPHLVFDGALKFELVSWGNTGTIWGWGQNATIPLMVLRCCAVVGLLWFLRNTPRTNRMQQFVLSLILAGALGNLFD